MIIFKLTHEVAPAPRIHHHVSSDPTDQKSPHWPRQITGNAQLHFHYRPRLHSPRQPKPQAVFRCTSLKSFRCPFQKTSGCSLPEDHRLEILLPVIVGRLENRTGNLPVQHRDFVSADPLRCFLHGRQRNGESGFMYRAASRRSGRNSRTLHVQMQGHTRSSADNPRISGGTPIEYMAAVKVIARGSVTPRVLRV